jgi:hypothetical protein
MAESWWMASQAVQIRCQFGSSVLFGYLQKVLTLPIWVVLIPFNWVFQGILKGIANDWATYHKKLVRRTDTFSRFNLSVACCIV